jgi:hypothetical protein
MSESRLNECNESLVLLHSQKTGIPVSVQPIPAQATNDLHLITLWLHGRTNILIWRLMNSVKFHRRARISSTHSGGAWNHH